MLKFTTIANARKETGLSYLGGINISSKIMKNQKVSHNYTYVIYLAPASTSGYNICSHSTPECRIGCLATSGRAGMELLSGNTRTQNARIKKSKLFSENTQYFMAWVIAEIGMYQRKAIRDGYDFSVRLNGTSDICYNSIKINGKTIFEIFPDTNFYDYTKSNLKFENKPNNYHLTFSYTGRNWLQCEVLLKQEFNVAMVFNVKNGNELPTMFNGYEVIDGDLTDARFLDKKGVIVGLKFKRIADKEAQKTVINSCFVVQPNDVRCSVI